MKHVTVAAGYPRVRLLAQHGSHRNLDALKWLYPRTIAAIAPAFIPYSRTIRKILRLPWLCTSILVLVDFGCRILRRSTMLLFAIGTAEYVLHCMCMYTVSRQPDKLVAGWVRSQKTSTGFIQIGC
jgi:hypothetical protein